MFKWSCEIERAMNGFILKNTSSPEENMTELQEEVFQDKQEWDNNDNEFEARATALVDLFWRLSEYFGIFNSEYYSKRLEIKIIDNTCDFEERCEYLEEKNKYLKKQYEELNGKYKELLKKSEWKYPEYSVDKLKR